MWIYSRSLAFNRATKAFRPAANVVGTMALGRFRDPLLLSPGPPSRPVACAGGQCRYCGGRASQDGGVAPRQHSVAALALAERRPAQLPFWTQAEGAAKRSGAAPRPGNEGFAL